MEGLVGFLTLAIWGGCWFLVVKKRRRMGKFSANAVGAIVGLFTSAIFAGIFMPQPSPEVLRQREEAARIKAESKRLEDAEKAKREAEAAKENAKREAEAAKLKDRSIMAAIICSNHVEYSLKAPKSADFPFSRAEGGIQRLADQQYVIRSYVDAQNSFGAQLRNWYTCRIQYRAGDEGSLQSWTLLSLDFE